MPLQRRLPIRGFNNERFKTYFALVQVQDLEVFPAGSVVDLNALWEVGLVNNPRDGVKVLGTGELSKALTVRATAFSKSAAEKISAAGGKAEVI
jgi:large subunit ribosomal protein L15